MSHSCHQPLVSIVIPTYNHGHLIGRALNSVVNQTFSHWEAIVVDNYSCDDTYEVVSRFYDPRIRYYKFHNNGIIAASRNFGIKVSNGSWIAFLDSDDWWSFNKLEKCVLLATSNIDIVYHDLYLARHHCQKLFVRRVRSRVLSPTHSVIFLIMEVLFLIQVLLFERVPLLPLVIYLNPNQKLLWKTMTHGCVLPGQILLLKTNRCLRLY